MNATTVKISKVKENPNNPRFIRDEKFQKLVQSIKDFPEMLSLRPIVVNDEMVVLGGNMRLKACKEAGLSEIPIIVAKELSETQQREFVIKDNLGFGEWDWDKIADEWDYNELSTWGLEIPLLGMDGEFNDKEGYDFLNKVTIEFETFEKAQEYYNNAVKDNLKARLS